MPAATDFKHNHYVAEWYQKRFMLPGQQKYWRLDLKPERRESNGHSYVLRADMPIGPKSCFAKDDLYTTKWGGAENVDIEKFFFGRVDSEGKSAVEFFADFAFDRAGQNEAYEGLMKYMSVQKLRTPKGLGWLQGLPGTKDRNMLLMALQTLQEVFCATWTECVWQIADATQSPTKFIISDHPVTVYNRACFPGSPECAGFGDPDIRMVATHTYFPLSIDKILILTNLAWVRNPYQGERVARPNPKLYHSAIFKFTDIQIFRSLNEQEVREINYITKRRALRYIAGAEREWLHPEKHLRFLDWKKFGSGLLLMPEPRDIAMGGEVYVGYKGGGSDAWSSYGHKPWEKGFKDDALFAIESKALDRFQAEWSVMQGPVYRGTSAQYGRDPDGPHVMSDEFHQEELDRACRYKRRARLGRAQ